MTSTLIPTAYYLKQRNPRWRDVALGFSSSSIGDYGCAITCVAMLLNFRSAFALFHTPLSVNSELMKHNAYRSMNLVDWHRIPDVFPDAKLSYAGRIDCPDKPAPLDRIDALLDKGMPVIVYVDYSTAPGLQQHFVVIHANVSGNYVIADPYEKHPTLVPAYGKDAKTAVCGIIMYEAAK